MTTTGNEFRPYLKWFLLLLCFIPSIHRIKAAAINSSVDNNFERCNFDDLEKQFIPENAKCPRSGLFPVKGSCNAYVVCLTFDRELLRPIRRMECPSGETFDLQHSRCKPIQKKTKNCLQRACYPAEAFLEDSKLPPSTSSREKINSNRINAKFTNADNVDEIVLDVQQYPAAVTNASFDDEVIVITTIHTNNNNSLLISSSAVAENGNLNLLLLLHLFIFKFLDKFLHKISDNNKI